MNTEHNMECNMMDMDSEHSHDIPILMMTINPDGSREIRVNPDLNEEDEQFVEEAIYRLIHGNFEYFEYFEDLSKPPDPRKLTSEEFNNLETLRVDGSFIINLDCPICLDTFLPSEYVKVLPCKHGLHQSCAKSWLFSEKASCPTCRMDV